MKIGDHVIERLETVRATNLSQYREKNPSTGAIGVVVGFSSRGVEIVMPDPWEIFSHCKSGQCRATDATERKLANGIGGITHAHTVFINGVHEIV